jgi:hypothetical protein
MWEDPVVKDTRELRNEYAHKFNGDIEAMFQDILRRQQEHSERLVSLPPRSPKQRKSAA